MKDKTMRLLEAIDNPNLFDEGELKKMLDDPEMADIYMAMNRTTDALTETRIPDIDKEWDSFVERNFPARSRDGRAFIRGFFSRKAASIAIIALAAMSIVAAGIGISYSISNKTDISVQANEEIGNISGNQKLVAIANDSLPSEAIGNPETSMVIFKDVALDEILMEICLYYGTTVIYENEATKKLHLFFQWNRSLSLEETASQLNNFQQIDIKVSDNSIIVR